MNMTNYKVSIVGDTVLHVVGSDQGSIESHAVPDQGIRKSQHSCLSPVHFLFACMERCLSKVVGKESMGHVVTQPTAL